MVICDNYFGGISLMQWSKDQLKMFEGSKTLTIKPFNQDLKTFEEVSPIWEVVVDGKVYSRGWNGQKTKWYHAAVTQKSGEIEIDSHNFNVEFTAVADESLIEKITSAYQKKYAGESSLERMTSEEPAHAAVQVSPR